MNSSSGYGALARSVRALHEISCKATAKQTQLHQNPPVPNISQRESPTWVRHVIALLDAAIDQLDSEQAAHDTILQASIVLRRQLNPQPPQQDNSGGSEWLAMWQVRKVLEHIDRGIGSRVLVADLCALVQRSEAHFSRAFRRTFGDSPHAFVVRRRVDLAAQYMLQTDEALSAIALRCGFVDQAHLSKHFRRTVGETPAAWRRSRRAAMRT